MGGREKSCAEILYIEDNHANLVLMQSIFAMQDGMSLSSAETAEEGLQRVRSDRPDLVLLDLHLPDGNGTEVLRKLKEDHTTSSIPIVAVTADARSEQQRQVLDAGADAYVTKPIDIEHLLTVIDRALQRTEE